MSQPTTTKVPFGLGTANIVLGGLQLAGCLVWALSVLLAVGETPVPVPGVALAVFLIFLFLGFASGALLLVGGIGLVKYRSWGRIVSIVWAILELVLGLVLMLFAILALAAGLVVPAIFLMLICLIMIAYPIVLLVMLNSKQVIAALDGQRAVGGAPARPSPSPGVAFPSSTPAGPVRGGAAMPYGTPPRAGAPAGPGGVPATAYPSPSQVGPGAGPTTVYTSPAPAGRYAAASHGGGETRDTQVIRPPAPRVSLQQMGGRENGRTEQLEFRDPFGRPITNDIGREGDCRIVITGDPSVSHHHCRLGEDENGNLYVCDLDSREGTFAICGRMRPQRVRGKMYIRDGDILLIGGVMFTVRVAKAPTVEELWYR